MAQAGELKEGQSTPKLKITIPKSKPDYATIFGLIAVFGLIVSALFLGGSPSAFIDLRSFLIVFCGTLAVVFISFTGNDFIRTLHAIRKSLYSQEESPKSIAHQLVNLAVIARLEGILALEKSKREIRKDAFLYRGIQMVSDGHTSDELFRILGQEIDAQLSRHSKGVNILRRASEAAPAMGLIGTLIGLVQMLALLDDPRAIGPSMALALLTTFYGAMLGTVVFAPLAAKLEARSNSDALRKHLIMLTLGSIARQENPRRLEMILNSELPPAERIRYFDV